MGAPGAEWRTLSCDERSCKIKGDHADRRDLSWNGTNQHDLAVDLRRAASSNVSVHSRETECMGPQVTVVMLIKAGPGSRLRALLRLMFGKWALRRVPGVTFCKMLGSGRDGGFLPAPSLHHHGLLCVFSDRQRADSFLETSGFADGCRRGAAELLEIILATRSCRGSWAGKEPFQTDEADMAAPGLAGPVVSLTRASIRPAKASRFWRHAPGSQEALRAAGGCLLSVGLGEAPVLRQATFTMWENERAMTSYARTGAHMEAIKQAKAGDFFSESLFAKFDPLLVKGAWQGVTYDWSPNAKAAPSVTDSAA